MEEKVVKCGNEQCGLHFGYSEGKTSCPFCHTPYGKVEEKPKERKLSIKRHKESFKIWKDRED